MDPLEAAQEAEAEMIGAETLQLRRVVDSRIAVNEQKLLILEEGPSAVTYQAVLAASQRSLTPTFSVQLPSYGTGLGRRVLYHFRGTIRVTGEGLNVIGQRITANFPNPAPAAATGGNRIALRAWPLHNCMNSTTVSMNNMTLSLGSVSQYVAGLAAVNRSSRSCAQVQSSVGTAPDVYSDYSDASAHINSPFEAAAEFGYNTASMSSRTVSIVSAMVSNNGLALPNAVPADSNRLDIVVDIVEPLIISPFGYDEEALMKAIYGLSTVNFTWTLQDIHRMLSLDLSPSGGVTPVITGVSIVTADAADGSVALEQSLEVTFITPKDTSLISVDRPYSYSNTDIQLFTSVRPVNAPTANNTTPGVNAITLSSNVVELSTIPSKFVIFVTPSPAQLSDVTRSTADLFYAIDSIQCSFGTRSGLLSSATSAQLWELSERNGVHLPYGIWAGRQQFAAGELNQGRGAGGVLVLSTAGDLSLPTGLVPGQNQRVSFQITSMQARNQSRVAFTEVQVTVLALTDGIITNRMGASTKTAGGVPVLSLEELERVETLSSGDLRDLDEDGGYGGISKAGKFFRGVGRFFKKLLPFIAAATSKAFPEAAPAIEVASSAIQGAGVIGGSVRGGGELGGLMLGGARADNVLADRIRGGRAVKKSMYM